MNLVTLANARDAIKRWAEGGNCSSTLLTARVNECVRRLVRKVDHRSLQHTMRICTRHRILPCPREVDKILAADVNGAPVNIFGRFYEFMMSGPGDHGSRTQGRDFGLEDIGSRFPTFFDLPPGQELPLVAYSPELADKGVEIVVHARDTYSREMHTGSTPGLVLPIQHYLGGVEGAIARKFVAGDARLSPKIKEVTRVIKPVTAGSVTLYCVDVTTAEMWLLGTYHPDDTVPAVHRYRISNKSCPEKGADEHATMTAECVNVLALVKLGYVPLSRDNDILPIDSVDAVKLMSMAIEEENAKNIQEAEFLEAKALRLLSEAEGSQSVSMGGPGYMDRLSIAMPNRNHSRMIL